MTERVGYVCDVGWGGDWYLQVPAWPAGVLGAHMLAAAWQQQQVLAAQRVTPDCGCCGFCWCCAAAAESEDACTLLLVYVLVAQWRCPWCVVMLFNSPVAQRAGRLTAKCLQGVEECWCWRLGEGVLKVHTCCSDWLTLVGGDASIQFVLCGLVSGIT